MNGITMYYLVVITAALLGYFSQLFAKDKKNKMKLNKTFFILSFLTLFIFLGFRNFGTGVDDYNYRAMFQYTRNYGIINSILYWKIEPGFMIINYIIGLFTDDYQILIKIVSFISLFFIYKMFLYEKKSVNYFYLILSYGFLVYPYFFGIIRLSLAMSISFYAFRFFIEGNRKKFNWLILLASSIHFSCLMMLFFNFILKKELNSKNLKKSYIFAIIVLPIIFVFIKTIIIPIMGSRYFGYANSNSIKLSIGLFDKIPIIFLFYIFYNNMKSRNNNSKYYVFLYVSC